MSKNHARRFDEYDKLKGLCIQLMAEGKLPERPTPEQKIDIVYGNCKLSNPDVTREMVEKVVLGPLAFELGKLLAEYRRGEIRRDEFETMAKDLIE